MKISAWCLLISLWVQLVQGVWAGEPAGLSASKELRSYLLGRLGQTPVKTPPQNPSGLQRRLVRSLGDQLVQLNQNHALNHDELESFLGRAEATRIELEGLQVDVAQVTSRLKAELGGQFARKFVSNRERELVARAQSLLPKLQELMATPAGPSAGTAYRDSGRANPLLAEVRALELELLALEELQDSEEFRTKLDQEQRRVLDRRANALVRVSLAGMLVGGLVSAVLLGSGRASGMATASAWGGATLGLILMAYALRIFDYIELNFDNLVDRNFSSADWNAIGASWTKSTYRVKEALIRLNRNKDPEIRRAAAVLLTRLGNNIQNPVVERPLVSAEVRAEVRDEAKAEASSEQPHVRVHESVGDSLESATPPRLRVAEVKTGQHDELSEFEYGIDEEVARRLKVQSSVKPCLSRALRELKKY